MSNEGLAFIVFVAGMLLLMGIGMNMALALVLTGAGMALVELIQQKPLDLGHGAEVE